MTAAPRSDTTRARLSDVGDGPRPVVIVGALVVLAVVSADVLLGGPLSHLDHRVGTQMDDWGLRWRPWPRRSLTLGVIPGQRGYVLTGAAALAAWLGWRNRTSEPVVRLAVAVVSLLAVVYAFKLGLARNAPIQDSRGEAAGHGASFPSGHVANAVLLWGWAYWSACRFRLPRMVRRVLGWGRWAAPVAVSVAMTLLNYHWITDFLGGAAVGVILLAWTLLPAWSRLAWALDTRWAP